MSNYHFCRVSSKYDVLKKSSWYFIAEDIDQLKEHWEKYASSEIKEGTRQLVDRVSGDCSGSFTNSFASAVNLLSETNGSSYLINSVQLENEIYQQRKNDLIENGEIWLSNGISVFSYNSKIHDILEEIYLDVLTYPDELSPDMKDLRILMWPGGKHWYAKIGKIDITDDQGNQKWNTYEEAEKAAKEFIKRNYK